MAVVGVMALLAVVAAPALRGLAGTGGRKQALNQIMGAMELARNTAIANGTNAGLVIPDNSFVRSNYAFRSLAVAAWNPTNAAAPPSMISGWISLPEGIAIFPTSVSPLPRWQVNVVIPPAQTNLSLQPMIVFQSDGSLLPSGDGQFPTNGLAIFEGSVSGTTANRQGRTNRVETITLSPYTGRPRGTLRAAP